MFRPNCSVFAMIQPEPLPGSYRHEQMTIEEIVELVLKETDMVVANGFDGVIIQNMNDMPIKQISRPEAIAYMTRIGLAVKEKYPNLIMGILVNWDGVAGLAIADAVGADFVRIEHLYTGAEVTSAGILEAQCVDICELKKRIKSKVLIYADVYEVHGMPICKKSWADAAWECVNEAFADGLFVSGKTVEESIKIITEIKQKCPNVPVLLGGGANGDNIQELLKYYDGVSIATWIKDGDMKNPINPEKAQIFMQQVALAKQNKNNNLK